MKILKAHLYYRLQNQMTGKHSSIIIIIIIIIIINIIIVIT